MRLLPVLIALTAIFAALACSGQDDGVADDRQPSFFFDSQGPVNGPPTLWERMPDDTPAQLLAEADAVVVGTVTGIVSGEFENITPVPGATGAQKQILEKTQTYLSLTPSYTTFVVEVSRSIKGPDTGRRLAQVTVTQNGGFEPDGLPSGFMDGDLLLEPGRSYIMFLKTNGRDGFYLPGGGEYVRIGVARGTFDVTDSTIKVMNHLFTEDLERLEGLTVDEFIAQELRPERSP